MPQIGVNILTAAAIDLLIGLSCFICFLPSRFLNLSQGAIIAVAAYGVHFFTAAMALPMWWGIILSVTCAIVVGVALDLVIFRRLSRMGAKSWALLLVSLGVYEIVQNGLSLAFGDNVKILNPTIVQAGHLFCGAYITNVQIATVCASAVFFVASVGFLQFSRFGKAVRGVSSNSDLCQVFGINREQITLLCVGIGSAIAGVAGILSGLDIDIAPTMGFRLLLNGIIVLIVAGVGRIGGLLASASLLAASQQLAAYYFDAKWMDAAAFVILIVFLIWKPLGFDGQRLKKVEV